MARRYFEVKVDGKWERVTGQEIKMGDRRGWLSWTMKTRKGKNFAGVSPPGEWRNAGRN